MNTLSTAKDGGMDPTYASVRQPTLREQQIVAAKAMLHLLDITGLPDVFWRISAVDGGLEGQVPVPIIPVEEHRKVVEAYAEVLGADTFAWGENDQYVQTSGVYQGARVQVWGLQPESAKAES